MKKALKFLPAVLVGVAVVIWSASFNDSMTSTATIQRVIALGLLALAGAATAYLMRTGIFKLTSKGLVGFGVGAVGFLLLALPSDDYSSWSGIAGICLVIGGGSIVQDSFDEDAAADENRNS